MIAGALYLKNMAKKKEDKKPTIRFKAKVNGKEKTFEFVLHKFIVPGIGLMTSAEAAKNKAALAHLVSVKSGVIEEIKAK